MREKQQISIQLGNLVIIKRTACILDINMGHVCRVVDNKRVGILSLSIVVVVVLLYCRMSHIIPINSIPIQFISSGNHGIV